MLEFEMTVSYLLWYTIRKVFKIHLIGRLRTDIGLAILYKTTGQTAQLWKYRIRKQMCPKQDGNTAKTSESACIGLCSLKLA